MFLLFVHHAFERLSFVNTRSPLNRFNSNKFDAREVCSCAHAFDFAYAVGCATTTDLELSRRAVVKAPKSCHITPVLRSLYWLKITERIEYKLLSLTTTQPPYLHHLISVQPPRITRSSSLVTLARPPTSSSLRITDRYFRYASHCLWNQLPSSFCQPHFSPSVSVLPVHAPATSSHSVNSQLSPSITPSLFHSRLSQDLPLSQIFPTIDSLPASGLTPRTSRPDRFF